MSEKSNEIENFKFFSLIKSSEDSHDNVISNVEEALARFNSDMMGSMVAFSRRIELLEAKLAQLAASDGLQKDSVPRPEPTRFLRVPADELLVGEGWHFVETDGSGLKSRWGGQKAVSTIYIAGTFHNEIEISLKLSAPAKASVFAAMKVIVNGMPCKITKHEDRKFVERIDFRFADTASNYIQDLEICLVFSKRFCPADAEASADTRMLGVRLAEVTVSSV